MIWTPETWDRDRWPHFGYGEMACRHCGANHMDPAYMDSLQWLRGQLGPLRVGSGYRCPLHPVEAAKDAPGVHTLGKAADIAIAGAAAHALLKVAFDDDFTGIGIKQHGNNRFIHLDTVMPTDGAFPRPMIWSYS